MSYVVSNNVKSCHNEVDSFLIFFCFFIGATMVAVVVVVLLQACTFHSSLWSSWEGG